MQHRFIGDIGDFGKYGVLRVLGAPPLTLAVVWYLVESSDAPPPGRTTRYLTNPSRFRSCDPPLFDCLACLVATGERTVHHLQSTGIFPEGTVFYPDYLPSTEHSSTLWESRVSWLEGALTTTFRSDLVFLDPDNGIAPPTVTPADRRGNAYVFPQEIPPFLSRGQSLLIYHHLSRRWKAATQIAHLLDRLSTLTAIPPLALRFHRGGSRLFIIIPSSLPHRVLLEPRVEYLVHLSPWSEHFTLVRD